MMTRSLVKNNCRMILFFNDTATTEIYTLSLHDALPILTCRGIIARSSPRTSSTGSRCSGRNPTSRPSRSEEHTSELQSRLQLVCRLLLEKKNTWSALYPEYVPAYNLMLFFEGNVTFRCA